MDLLKASLLLSLSVFITSCAKVGYMIDQGTGQLKLQARARPNEEVLKDPRISAKNKQKIATALEAKEYFYKYFGKKETGIYTKTTLLDHEMVTTLVIVSPYNKIEAQKECFPLVGCFPYLGFFDPEDAREYAREKEQGGFVTYSRPVYAYSTLGHFEDTILSSFFHYSEEELVELIFHELFHTIFFVKDEVDLNENLANHFGEKLRAHYLGWDEKKLAQEKRKDEQQEGLSKLIVSEAAVLSKLYQAHPGASKEVLEAKLAEFLADRFNPKVKAYCEAQKIAPERCWPLKRKWNNASFAAFLTYEQKAQRISELQNELKLDLLGLYALLEKSYDCYDKLSSDKKDNLSFEQLLFEKRAQLCPDISSTSTLSKN